MSVVTQPGFIADRGERYLREVDPRDHDDLYRYCSLLEGGVTTVASSDAPFGPLDPWRILAAAADRLAPDGRTVAAAEAVPVETALDGMLRDPLDLTRTRRIAVGEPADLVLLHAPLTEAVRNPHAGLVRQTWWSGTAQL